MELQHRFNVPASIDETWEAFNDIGSIAGCFPGATLLKVEGDRFDGTVKIKLGPISMQYSGTAEFVERDVAARRIVIHAGGKDKRGQGTADATVTALLAPGAGTSTDIEVNTDLAITGKPAQFGRGMIQDVSERLLTQFVDAVSRQLSAPEPEVEATPEAAPRPLAAAPPAAAPAADAAGELNLAAVVLPALARRYGGPALGVALVAFLAFRLGARRR
jgi:carbon monoxide dehydrogenase subunit G